MQLVTQKGWSEFETVLIQRAENIERQILTQSWRREDWDKVLAKMVEAKTLRWAITHVYNTIEQHAEAQKEPTSQ